MAGLIGIIKNSGHTWENLPRFVTAMEEEITYTGTEVFDRWNNGHYAITRVHHGILNKAPQPIFNEDGSLCIVMDGEIFDYQLQKQCLIKQGHRFGLKDNDPEYCLHLYETNDSDAFVKLNGSFLIALYNVNLKELLLVNDRFSSRPLFYYYDQKKLIFGTQLRPLLKLQQLPRHLDLQAVLEFFAFQRVLADRTLYQDVKVLPPASILRFRDGRLFLEQYWKMRYTNEARSEAYYVEALADALRNAVARRTRGNHRFGILLSGGLDSRVILAADDGKISRAFTLGDFENKEVRIAREIAQAKGCKHIFLHRDLDHYFRLVDEAIDIGDGMYRFDHAHFLGFLQKIKEECSVILHGYGLDYTFQGLYLPLRELNVVRKTIPLPLLYKTSLAALPMDLIVKYKYNTTSNAQDVYPQELFQDHISNQFNKAINKSIQEILKNKDAYGSNVYNAWDYFILHSLYKHFTFLNFLCVRAYIDERTTIFDNDLFNLYLSMPPQLRLKGRVYRKALRLMTPELAAIPNACTGLNGDMPISMEWMLTLSKSALLKLHILSVPQLPNLTFSEGSWPNRAELIRNNEKLKKLIWETIHDLTSINPDLFDMEAIDSIFKKHISCEGSFTDLIFLLLTFGRWHRRYGPK